MISIRNVCKQFGKLKVLNSVSAELSDGECIALIGPNGCGKTTLIKSILGMVMPNSGDITIKGKSIRNEFRYRNDIGYMPQIGKYPENMTIGQVITMIMNIRNNQEALDEELLEAYQLKKLYNKKMHTLSGGTTQKVSATLAFLFNPSVLILDEPTAGLDPLASEILKNKILKEREKGKLILITSHLLSELDELVSEIIFMQEGNILLHKNALQLQSETNTTTIAKAITQLLKLNA
jgi:Cu-processing system ATP-binding protein